MKIEPITAEMAEEFRDQIAHLYFENLVFCAFLSHFSPEEANEKIGGFIEHLKEHTAISYGAFENDELYGFVWAYPHQFREEKRMYVNEIRVKEEFRKRGIGSQLLRQVEERAKEIGFNAIYLHAEADSSEVLKFYETSGYKTERIQLRKEIQRGSQDADRI